MAPFNPLLPKNLLRLFLAMAALALVLRLIGPSLVSTDRMEREIEAKIAAWTGAKLSISGTPEFAFWPNPQFRFDHARLRNPDVAGGEGTDLLTVERVSVDFSPISSLFGTPNLGAIELVRPTFLFHRDESGALNWHKGNGIASKDGAQAENVAPPDFGTIIVRDGTIVVDDRKRHERYAIAHVEGKIDWPTISRSPGWFRSAKAVSRWRVRWSTVTCRTPPSSNLPSTSLSAVRGPGRSSRRWRSCWRGRQTDPPESAGDQPWSRFGPDEQQCVPLRN